MWSSSASCNFPRSNIWIGSLQILHLRFWFLHAAALIFRYTGVEHLMFLALAFLKTFLGGKSSGAIGSLPRHTASSMPAFSAGQKGAGPGAGAAVCGSAAAVVSMVSMESPGSTALRSWGEHGTPRTSPATGHTGGASARAAFGGVSRTNNGASTVGDSEIEADNGVLASMAKPMVSLASAANPSMAEPAPSDLCSSP
jgi:hypothetical protein